MKKETIRREYSIASFEFQLESLWLFLSLVLLRVKEKYSKNQSHFSYVLTKNSTKI